MNKRKAENFIFYIFLGLLIAVPFNTKKLIESPYSYFSGHLNEFVSYFVYVTDFLIITIILSNLMLHRKNLNDFSKNLMRDKISLLMLLFIFWISVGNLFTSQYFDLSLYRTLRLIEYFLFAVTLNQIIANEKRLNLSFLALSFTGAIQGLIAGLQFLTQSSIFGAGFLHKITGESIIGSNIVGTSNVLFESGKIVRAYGTFPHPNILAGFLVVTVILTFYLYKNRHDLLSANEYNNTYNLLFQVFFKKEALSVMVILQIIGLFLTFSRAAFLSILTVCVINGVMFQYVPRGTYKLVLKQIKYALSPNRVISIALLLSLTTLLASLFYIVMSNRIANESVNHQSYQERKMLYNVSRETISNKPVAGTGIGTYILSLRDIDQEKSLEYWQYQPDHNTYFLIASETGLVGLFIYLYIIFNLYERINILDNNSNLFLNKAKSLQLTLKNILLAILFLGLFDHYFWTSHHAQVLLWLTFGFILSLKFIYVPRGTKMLL